MPSGKNFTLQESREMQRKSVISRKRNSLSRADGEKQQPTRERKARAIELHDRGLTVNEIKTKMGLSRRTINRYLHGG